MTIGGFILKTHPPQRGSRLPLVQLLCLRRQCLLLERIKTSLQTKLTGQCEIQVEYYKATLSLPSPRKADAGVVCGKFPVLEPLNGLEMLAKEKPSSQNLTLRDTDACPLSFRTCSEKCITRRFLCASLLSGLVQTWVV
jgi:hypothetical protein